MSRTNYKKNIFNGTLLQITYCRTKPAFRQNTAIILMCFSRIYGHFYVYAFIYSFRIKYRKSASIFFCTCKYFCRIMRD